jgi:phage major head subunit gpT-like protein
MSDLDLLSSRAITGMYYAALETDPGLVWLDKVSNLFGSDQASETYNFLGQSPGMRQWVGNRQAKGFNGQGITILNTHYEGTIEIAKKDARRDKTGQIRARMGEFAQRGQTHWASLSSTLILNGAASLCYDGQYFFDTDHTEGENTTNQSNSITVTLSRSRSTRRTTARQRTRWSRKCSKPFSRALCRSSGSWTTATNP